MSHVLSAQNGVSGPLPTPAAPTYQGVFKVPPSPSGLLTVPSDSSLARHQQQAQVSGSNPDSVGNDTGRKQQQQLLAPPTGGSTQLHRSKSDKTGNGGRPLSKCLSRSHDNLASQLRKKATASALDSAAAAKNGAEVHRSKPPKSNSPLPDPAAGMRKAVSSQSINKPEEPMTRTQSAQNISSASSKAAPVAGSNPEATGHGGAAGRKLPSVPKRAVSTQNISNKQKTRQARIAASNTNAMAYNAELLASFEKEKKTFERTISELRKESENRKTEIERLKIELKHCRQSAPTDAEKEETRRLRAKLCEMGVSMDSDRMGSADRQPSGSSDVKDATHDPAASTLGTCDSELAFSQISDLSGGGGVPTHHSDTAEQWERNSNKSDSNLSEISVACLQDRISQMEETHYSTNEELQATLMELKDLQDTVNELALENERLNDEKAILLESLCAQTEKLEKYRMQVDHLKHLVVGESESGDRSANETQLVALIKLGQEEKEELLLRQMELTNSIHSYQSSARERQESLRTLQERNKTLEHRSESLAADVRLLETQLAELKEHNAREHIEAARFKTLYENEKARCVEAQQLRQVTGASDIEALLERTWGEKDKLEERLANKQEQLEITRNEVQKLREQVASQSEQMKVIKNNSKSEVHDFEYRMALRDQEKQELQQEISRLREHVVQLELEQERHTEDRRTHETLASKLEGDLKGCRQKIQETENELREYRNKYKEEQWEWQQLHGDLLTTVVIANQFKTEAQERTEQVVAENAFLKKRYETLQDELNQVQRRLTAVSQQREAVSGLRGRVLNTVDRELLQLRHSQNKGDRSGQASSVKLLIHSIEEQMQNSPPLSPTYTPSSLSPNYTPLSPTMPLIENAPRRNSTESIGTVGKGEGGERGNMRQSEGGGGAGQFKALLRNKENGVKEGGGRPALGHRHTISNIIYESAPASGKEPAPVNFDSPEPKKSAFTSILKDTAVDRMRHSSFGEKEKSPENGFGSPSTTAHGLKSDPLANLAKQMGGSKRNALLKWCQQRTANYTGIDITNFSSSWNDGLAFCALLHSYLPDMIPCKELNTRDKLRNFELAFKAGESVNIPAFLNASDMASLDRPDWNAVMSYVVSIFLHFEASKQTQEK